MAPSRERLTVVVACLCIAVECAYAKVQAEDSDSVEDSDSEESMGNRIRDTFRSLAGGLDEEGLPPMDPVVMRDLAFCRGYGAVRANIEFPFSTLAGVSDVDAVSNIRCTPGASLLEFHTHHDRLVQDGQYNLTGSFADVFAVGKGGAHIVLRDVTIAHRLQWRRARGELRVKEYRGSVAPRDMTVRYDNLRAESRDVLLDECRRQYHDGGSAGARHRPHRRPHRAPRHRFKPRRKRKSRRRRGGSHVDVNKYFNANWEALYDSLSQSVDISFSLVFREYMEVVLRAVEPFLRHCEGRDLDDDLDDNREDRDDERGDEEFEY
ncbi:uncharacterized protein LOC117650573 isoform X1 [Thrips palmi]|uniref:Uncharacterized protein LOC117650573 isoform X1 n=1 Tax=Thrips palmi TaxID=161013 RepID=A0A6P8ZY14_THRPL|nr:uncharacterized protein LOC117650573 isoform X1 [Thrips palmi]